MSTILARVIGGGSSAGTATARDVLAGKTFSNDDDVEIVGTATAVPATEYHVTTEDQTIITSDSHTTGNQTLKGITSENISVSNIRSGTTVKVNNGESDIVKVTGTYTSGLSSGQTAMTAAQLLAGYSGYVNGGNEIKGSMANKAGTTQTATVDRSGTDIRMKIPADGYYNTSAYLKAAGSVFGDAAAGHVLSGKYFTSSNGLKIQGSIGSQAAKTVYATTSDQTAVASGKYCSGAITVKKLTQTNLAAANIKKGVTISINNGSSNVWSVAGNIYRCLTGTVTTTSTTNYISVNSSTDEINTPHNSKRINIYYSDINPGFTPLHIFSYELWVSGSKTYRIFFRSDNLIMPFTNSSAVAYIVGSSSPKTSTQTRLYKTRYNTTIYYTIIGY